MEERDPHGKGCWYMTLIYECPVCMSSRTERQRRWDEKPEDPLNRYDYIPTYDWCES